MILSIYRTSGHSMEPVIKNGSFFIGSSLPFIFKKPKTGDMIIFKSDDKNIVKKIAEIKDNKYKVEGENERDSKRFGYLRKEEIMEKVIFII